MKTSGQTPYERWQFWIDRGGTFTDVVARSASGEVRTHKLLSENPRQYPDAALHGIRHILGLGPRASIPPARVHSIKMGTTVATNALLERKGERVVLVITKGFADALRIAYQNRPHLFAHRIILPQLLYERVVEIDERMAADGTVLTPVDRQTVRMRLQEVYDGGIRAAAIVLMHGYCHPRHEKQVARICREIGFAQISVSHQVSPLIKLIRRGDTTVADAYLSPILRRYVGQVTRQVGGTRLMFMQSNGGLTDARFFQGKNSILSGPAGGIVGAVKTSQTAGFEKVITFDMGGTSTDVSHYNGEYERTFETMVAGVRICAPMMHIHTVAAGGGSVLLFDGARYRVGPASAGARPGPACYRQDGPLTVTDCNVMLGRIQPDFFPKVFGPAGDLPLDAAIVRQKFSELSDTIRNQTGDARSPVEVADGFLQIAVENMANAIKKISTQRGYDVTGYTLCCFGGAAGQHACRVADALGMETVFIHPLAGVLSAYGMGLADIRVMREKSVGQTLTPGLLAELEKSLRALTAEAQAEISVQGISEADVEVQEKVHLRYEGVDACLVVDFSDRARIVESFESAHMERYGFKFPQKELTVDAVSVEVIGHMAPVEDPLLPAGARKVSPAPLAIVKAYMAGKQRDTAAFDRASLFPGDRVAGPALIVDAHATTVVEPGWTARVAPRNHLILTRALPLTRGFAVGTQVDPVMLEVFNNLFMSVAEQMGYVLANTAHSVNIKERLDFSCAIFDPQGGLIANAPHIPVHLGSMSQSVRSIIRRRNKDMRPGDVYCLNDPYNGGTHLPDVTVITPAFDKKGNEILFYVGARGHHADIGGVTPGSMPPRSTTVLEEGVLIDNFLLVRNGRFHEEDLMGLLISGPFPARNPARNISDLKAQVAACEKGLRELEKMMAHFGVRVVQAYMKHVQDNAREQVRRVLDGLKDGRFTCRLDDGSRIAAAVKIDKTSRCATIDFSGTSAQQPSNFNAPLAVCRAAVLYVFRTLVEEDIPMNEGIFKALKIIVPKGCMLDPVYPAAVVAGNVETSQIIADTLFGALGVLAGSQGTMNNFTFGHESCQYYETICGGAGAGPGFDGADAVHTHMTNTRLTDPEVLEWRFPVRLESFSIRRGTGGQGRYRGGDGAVRRIRFLEPMTASILSGRRLVAPFGLNGGLPGAMGHNRVERKNGRREDLPGTGQVRMNPGDVFVIETPGGGGFGQ
ncbi:MAG: hydantoinase B/oxoprolinase family protein [Desulfobacterales bacterium]|nr:hydantoinase B/oxoprolinase family protein [Desulfobacterales bacterium]